MNEIISYCGLICQSCPIFLLTREYDKNKKDRMIFEVISMCKEHYGVEYKYEDITDCDGCKFTNGRLFSGCINCKIRKCAIEKGFDNCAYCDKYVCDKLNEIFKTDSNAKMHLDNIRNSAH